MDFMVQPLRPPRTQPPLFRRLGVVLAAGLVAATALIAGNYEGLGPAAESTTVTAASLVAPRRPMHSADPAVTSPRLP